MQITPTERTTVRRRSQRGSYDRDLLFSIVDEALHCHVGFAIDGRPWVVPTIHARVDDQLYLHGALANHMLRSLAGGLEACVTMTLVDGLVIARSAFHHSLNYRSVMVFGRARPVDEREEKDRALRALVEHVAQGRSTHARPPTDEELRTTLVLRLPLTEASAKVRSGGPIDDDADLVLPVWAGVVPCRTVYDAPLPEEGVTVPIPAYLASYTRSR
jgi:nitroimidazol reductase NimA-like FMN-containing flavoprotein (pyridoxamine 5'-phosphate oxidase superfamily)